MLANLAYMKENHMTRLEKEIDDIFNTILFPARYAKSLVNGGSSYPPYNIIKLNDSSVVLEVAVAGFKESELEVDVVDGMLKIIGRKDVAESETNYIYKGIGTRAFERTFTLSPDAVINRAEYIDGILSVFVDYIKPEEKKSSSIPINKGERAYLAG